MIFFHNEVALVHQRELFELIANQEKVQVLICCYII